MVLTDESNYANVRIQLRRLRKKNMFGVPRFCSEIFPSSSIKKRRKSELKTPLKLPDVEFDTMEIILMIPSSGCAVCSLMNSFQGKCVRDVTFRNVLRVKYRQFKSECHVEMLNIDQFLPNHVRIVSPDVSLLKFRNRTTSLLETR